VENAKRTTPNALGGHLPETFPAAIYMRDRPTPLPDAEVLAVAGDDCPVLFRLRGNCLGFLGHPGAKSAMIEDLIMEFDETPPDTAETLARLRAVQGEVAVALAEIMLGIVALTGWMQPGP
jgi:hypothetical protein